MTTELKDTVFAGNERVADFEFNERVATVFDDMVSRSVPYYDVVQQLQAELVVEFLPDGECLVYDLGCSTGTTLELIMAHPRCPREARFIGVDNAPHMLAHARDKLGHGRAAGYVELIEADVTGVDLEPCHVIVMNWTLQFVRPIYRELLVQRIHDALVPGGAFFLSEKILVADSLLNRLYIDIYLRYKKRQGYTDEEIQRKREALENVLVPYRLEENRALLERCGFKTVDTCFRWANFASLVAIRR